MAAGVSGSAGSCTRRTSQQLFFIPIDDTFSTVNNISFKLKLTEARTGMSMSLVGLGLRDNMLSGTPRADSGISQPGLRTTDFFVGTFISLPNTG